MGSRRTALVTLGVSVISLATLAGATRPPMRDDGGLDALAAIVGTWQSDTTNGTSARSTCAWTPVHLAAVCDQMVHMTSGERQVISLYTYDAADGRYVFYTLPRPGSAMQPVALGIEGAVWTYGGVDRDPQGRLHRTINDFAGGNAYTWRAEWSTDGRHWTALAHGRSRRVN